MFRTKTFVVLAAICLLTVTAGIGSADAGYPRRPIARAVIRTAIVAPRIVARPYYGGYNAYRPAYGYGYRPGVSVNIGGGYPSYGYGYPGSGVGIQVGGFN